MCGRFTLTADPAQLQERFAIDLTEFDLDASYNIAPGQAVLAILNDTEPRAALLRWGLVPSWAKDIKIGNRLINARSETAAEKPSFRTALRRRRCLILADGFFEWQQTVTGKQPMYIQLSEHQPFAFAGLWESWHDPNGPELQSCTILTTEANACLRPIHQRMPVILPPASEATWLDRRITEPQVLLPLLQPYAFDPMEAYPVSSLVNSPRHNSAQCIAPLSPAS